MSEIEKQVFKNDAQDLTVVVMDREAFDFFCDQLKSLNMMDIAGELLPAGMGAERVREDGALYALTRGANTNYLFELYSIQTGVATFTSMKPLADENLERVRSEIRDKGKVEDEL